MQIKNLVSKALIFGQLNLKDNEPVILKSSDGGPDLTMK